jgi:diacylglycerol O-acyltransferase
MLNIICTNVPGSATALYTVGRRLLAAYPHVPTGYDTRARIAVQSYDGKLFFGLTADAHVVPDVHRLRDFILTSFRELCHAAGIKSPERSGGRGRKRYCVLSSLRDKYSEPRP